MQIATQWSLQKFAYATTAVPSYSPTMWDMVKRRSDDRQYFAALFMNPDFDHFDCASCKTATLNSLWLNDDMASHNLVALIQVIGSYSSVPIPDHLNQYWLNLIMTLGKFSGIKNKKQWLSSEKIHLKMSSVIFVITALQLLTLELLASYFSLVGIKTQHAFER